jgi:hypothetical protein
MANTKQTVKKEVKVNEPKKNDIQIHFGNIKVIEIKLLEAIAKNTAEIVRLLNKGN